LALNRRWNRLASSTSCFSSSACLQSLSSVLCRTAYGLESPQDRLGGTYAWGAGRPENTNSNLHTPYSAVSFWMTFSDLEWISTIFNDTKRCAVFLRRSAVVLPFLPCLFVFRASTWTPNIFKRWVVSLLKLLLGSRHDTWCVHCRCKVLTATVWVCGRLRRWSTKTLLRTSRSHLLSCWSEYCQAPVCHLTVLTPRVPLRNDVVCLSVCLSVVKMLPKRFLKKKLSNLHSVHIKKCHWFFHHNFYKYARIFIIFIARQHTDVRYWDRKFVRLSVCPSVRPSVTFRYQILENVH